MGNIHATETEFLRKPQALHHSAILPRTAIDVDRSVETWDGVKWVPLDGVKWVPLDGVKWVPLDGVKWVPLDGGQRPVHQPVLPEEDEVTLVVESDHAPSVIVGVGVEEASQQARHLDAEAGVEVVQDDLRPVMGHSVSSLRWTACGNSMNRTADVKSTTTGRHLIPTLLTNWALYIVSHSMYHIIYLNVLRKQN